MLLSLSKERYLQNCISSDCYWNCYVYHTNKKDLSSCKCMHIEKQTRFWNILWDPSLPKLYLLWINTVKRFNIAATLFCKNLILQFHYSTIHFIGFNFTNSVLFLNWLQILVKEHFMPELDIYGIVYQHQFAQNWMIYITNYFNNVKYFSFSVLYINCMHLCIFLCLDNEGLLGKQC